MWFVILWLILGCILIIHKFVSRDWITGQTAFTGAWFASLTGLWFSPDVWQLLSAYSVLLIIMSHGFFFIGSIIFSTAFYSKDRSYRKKIYLNNRSCKIIIYLFWIFLSFGFIGNISMAIRIETFTYFREQSLALLRHYLFEQIIPLFLYERIMSIFSYPAALLGTICFLFSKRKLKAILYIILPLITVLLNSINFGGRGAITICGLMIGWTIIIGRGIDFRSRNNINKFALIMLSIIIIYYFIFIFETRLNTLDDQVRRNEIKELSYWYLCGPIPAFSEWLRIYNELPIMSFDLLKFSIFRGPLNILGFQIGRTIDRDIIINPYPLNVFTHLSEYLLYFGVIGTQIICFLWGLLCGFVESKSLSIKRLALRSALYSYLTFSIYADIATLSGGWWLTIITFIVIYPFLEKVIFLKK